MDAAAGEMEWYIKSMFKEILREIIFLDASSEYSFGTDQVCNSYPTEFATVSLPLLCTGTLTRIVDRMRTAMDRENKPMSPFDYYTDAMCDQDGWYEFYVTLNTFTETKTCSCIEVIVDSSEAKDNGEVYYIDLDEYEQKALYETVDEQCKKVYKKSCEDLLKEAEEAMLERCL